MTQLGLGQVVMDPVFQPAPSQQILLSAWPEFYARLRHFSVWGIEAEIESAIGLKLLLYMQPLIALLW